MPTEYSVLPNHGAVERTRRMIQYEQPFLHSGHVDNQILYTRRNERGLVSTHVLNVHADGRVSSATGTYASIQEFARIHGVLPLDNL